MKTGLGVEWYGITASNLFLSIAMIGYARRKPRSLSSFPSLLHHISHPQPWKPVLEYIDRAHIFPSQHAPRTDCSAQRYGSNYPLVNTTPTARRIHSLRMEARQTWRPDARFLVVAAAAGLGNETEAEERRDRTATLRTKVWIIPVGRW